MSTTWPQKKLGSPEVATIILGQSPPSSSYNQNGSGLPFFQGKADFGLIHPTPRYWCNAGQQFATKNDILISVRAPVGDVNVAEGDCIIGRGVSAIRAKNDVDPWFLFFAMQHLKPVLENQATGTTFSSVNKATLVDLDVPIPPPNYQILISQYLRLVLTSITHQQAILGEAQELKRATMRELFTRGLRGEKQKETEIGLVPESWNISTIGSVALNTQYGMSVRGQPSGAYPILRMNCQEDGKVHYRNLQFVDLDIKTFESFKLNIGDLLFNRTNSIELVGRMAIVESDRLAVFASYLVRLTVDDNRCLPAYLNYFMNWPVTQSEIKKLASRAVGQANINASKLRTVQFPLPPTLDEQKEIIEILGAIDQKIDLHKRKKAVLEELFKSLLHKLMTGEICVTDLDLSALDIQEKERATA